MEGDVSRWMPIYIVDSFTSNPHTGNPAAVCLDDSKTGLREDEMLRIAAEMNLSETAFLRCPGVKDASPQGSRFDLRWFTPTREVPLCGHGTLATAAVLFSCGEQTDTGGGRTELTFDTLSGALSAKKNGSGISLILPLNNPCSLSELGGFENLLKLVVGPSDNIDEVQYCAVTKKLMVRLKDHFTRAYLEGLQPPIEQFVPVHKEQNLTGVIVTLKGNPETGSVSDTGERYDFISRYFAPWNGIPEDPVTGSAHTVLAGYWAQILHKRTMFARQCSKRGGELRLCLLQDDKLEISGPAIVTLKGQIRVS